MMADTRRTNGEPDPDTLQRRTLQTDTWRTSGRQGLEERPRARTQGGHEAGKKADTRRTRITQGGHEADAWGTPGGQVADKDWRRGQSQQHKADKWRTSGGQVAGKYWRRGQSQQHKADKWRTSGGQVLEARPKPTTQGGQEADKWRTSSGDAARAYRGPPFLRENPTVKCLGKNHQKKGKGLHLWRIFVYTSGSLLIPCFSNMQQTSAGHSLDQLYKPRVFPCDWQDPSNSSICCDVSKIEGGQCI